ncbi:DUF6603 domain-containing protein [Actinomadura napierensis]|uniref:DUF6603 domain-containing protein n=1 Tax=Actinomadura napierensis TaxID=267854 RepID=A0ABN2ZKY2_9ACTN
MIDLVALGAALTAQGTRLVMAATDRTLPAELRAFLGGVPGQSLTLARQAEPLAPAGDTLTITGTAGAGDGGSAGRATWPVQGFVELAVTVTSVTVTITNDRTTSTSRVTGTVTGTLPVGAATAAVTLTSVAEPAQTGSAANGAAQDAQDTIGWTITLTGSVGEVRGTDLIGLGQGTVVSPLPVPQGLDALDTVTTVQPSGFALTFYPNTGYQPVLAATVSVAGATWAALPTVLELHGVDIAGVFGPGSYSVTLVSHLQIGGTGVDLGVGMRPGTHWTAFLRPTGGGAFPGIAALARWIAGTGGDGEASATRLTSGLRALRLDTGALDAAITSVTVGFDWSAPSLDFVSVTSLISLGALRLDVALRLPDGALSGTLHNGAPVAVATILSSLGLPADGVPAGLTVADATFSAAPGIGVYSVYLVIDNVWGAGPLAIEQVGAALSYGRGVGLTGSVEGVLALGDSIEVQLEAGYEGATTGWAFAGATRPGSVIAVGDLLTSLATSFGIGTVPEILRTLTLTDVSVSYETGTGKFDFGAEADFTVAGADARLVVTVAVTRTAETAAGPATTAGTAGYSATFGGTLTVGALIFDLTFDLGAQPADVVLVATWRVAPERQYVGFGDLAGALGLPAPQVPDGLDLRLTTATLTYDVAKSEFVVAARSLSYGAAVFVATPVPADRAAGGNTDGRTEARATAYFAALAVGHPIDISDIPLLGQVLGAADTCAVEDLQVVMASTAISGPVAAAVNRLIPAGYPRLPAQGTASAIALSATLRFGPQTYPISLGAVSQTAGPPPAAGGTVVAAPKGGDAVRSTPPAESDGTAWFTVQKAFGPITFERVGVRYADGTLWFLLDASLAVGGLALTLQGASIGSPITGFSPRFDLRGLGVAYANPPLTIGGGFAKVTPTGGATFQYDGAVVVTLPQWGVTAYGSYAEINGEPSMFVFLQVSGAFGGPPAFFVTGLAGGFGYNSSIRIPGPDEVISFPLVGGLSDPAALGGAKATPMQALASLTGGAKPWISPTLGQNWLAVGIRFSTFQLLDSTALLVVEFGNELTIALLGISTARFPKSTAQRPYAQIQLQLRALLRPDDGFFALTAGLTRNSYLLDPACLLTGGFAFYVWFGRHAQAGDFVVVLGGYHPNFVPPPHYPVVAPLGFSWSLDKTVSISGSVYFALTPAAVMAGGALAVRYSDGNLRAWFTAHADLIMLWSPFHFSVRVGVSVGVEYTVNLLFTRKTLHLEAGADLQLAGPPTGGTATIRLWVVSFTVSFGARPASDPQPLDWTGFQALLPPAADATTFTAAAGLAAQQTDNAALAAATPVTTAGAPAPAPWQARPDGFAFSIRSAVPSTRLFIGQSTQTPVQSGAKVDIRPMRRTGLTVDQRMWITVGGAEIDLAAAGWQVTATTANLPKALWGTGDGKGVPAGRDQLVTGRLTGLSVRAPAPQQGWTAGPIAVAAALGIDPVLPAGVLPVTGRAGATGDVPVLGDTVATITDQIAAVGAARRDELFTALSQLGLAPATNGPLTRFAAQTEVLFTDQPLLVPAGS